MVLGLILAAVWYDPAHVGHWDDNDGYDDYLRSYDRAFQELPEQYESIDVRTDYGIVRFYRFPRSTGNPGTRSQPSLTGTPFLLLPGRASASPVWADNLPSLLEISDVYTIDLLGEPGMSVQNLPIRNAEEQAEWLHQAIMGLPEEQFIVMGLSIGGWSAANLALHHPEVIDSLILIDPVYTFANIPIGTAVRALPASLPWLPKSWRDSFNSYTAGGAPVEDEPVANMIESGMRHYRIKLPQPARITEEQLERLELPTLAILAGRSVMHDTTKAARTAERTLPDGMVLTYADASHAINGEYPERIAEDVAAFLKRR